MLSARQAVAAAWSAAEAAPDAQARAGAQTWLDELIWREFYQAILVHFPRVLEQSFRSNLQSIAWENDRVAFGAWRGRRGGSGTEQGLGIAVDSAGNAYVGTGLMAACMIFFRERFALWQTWMRLAETRRAAAQAAGKGVGQR